MGIGRGRDRRGRKVETFSIFMHTFTYSFVYILYASHISRVFSATEAKDRGRRGGKRGTRE